VREFYVSAPYKSSGKTLISIGLVGALSARGIAVAPFKKGPDYIDAGWLARGAKRACLNLDFNTMAVTEIVQCYSERCADADIALIEGTHGLHDGVDPLGADSNAALAKLLDVPILLVLDCDGMSRGVAALIRGLTEFDPAVRFSGVILNRVSGTRHLEKLCGAIEHYTDLRVFGAVSQDASIAIEQRHLGLVPGAEDDAAAMRIKRLAEHLEAGVDIDALCSHAEPNKLIQRRSLIGCESRLTGQRQALTMTPKVRIGIARDRAFCFYYADDLEQLRRHGAELIFFDALNTPRLPECDGLFIGGGFPETAMRELARNVSLRKSIADAAEAGMPIYAECGGLMYLARNLHWNDETMPMCGVLPFDVRMHRRPQGRGYVRLRETGAAPWGYLGAGAAAIAAHEFHYSTIENCRVELKFAYAVNRGRGIDGRNDGVVWGSVFASYAHLRNTHATPWARAMVDWVVASGVASVA
jgi:cobyrinic acid a,c-diamide synthase